MNNSTFCFALFIQDIAILLFILWQNSNLYSKNSFQNLPCKISSEETGFLSRERCKRYGVSAVAVKWHNDFLILPTVSSGKRSSSVLFWLATAGKLWNRRSRKDQKSKRKYSTTYHEYIVACQKNHTYHLKWQPILGL